MGVYVNPGCQRFAEAVSSEIYVDKTELIAYTNRCLNTEQKYICVSRPRRFGKSMAAYMLAAYYSRGIEAEELFRPYRISQDKTFLQYMNQYHLVFLNMQSFLSRSSDLTAMLARISQYLLKELLHLYPHIDYIDREDLIEVLQSITQETGDKFVFIIDEWDCIFRERKNHAEEQRQYLDFLRVLLKDQVYVSLAYMTGILPIKKYGTHSALNMFDEYSMANPGKMAKFAGFTEPEVKDLCETYHMDFQETRRWYDGYSLALSCTIALALYCAREYYMMVREFPTGKGYADIVYIPRRNHLDKPALVVELK